MSSRHYLVSSDDLPQWTSAAAAWPSNVRYAIWSYHAGRGALRAYVEFSSPVRKRVLLGGPCHGALELTREQRRQLVLDFDGAVRGERGSWEDGRRGRPRGSAAQASVLAQLSAMQHHIDEQQRQISELQSQVSQAAAAAGGGGGAQPITNIAQQNNINITQNIVVNSFGHEDVSYLPLELLRERLFQHTEGLLKTIEDEPMNEAHPENQNVRVVAARDGTVAVRKDNGWVAQPVSYTVDRMILKGYMLNRRGAALEGPAPSETSQLLQDHDLAWNMEIGRILELGNTKKDHVVKARQRVRTLLINKCKRLPRCAIGSGEHADTATAGGSSRVADVA